VQFKSKISPEDHFALYAKVARELASRLPLGSVRNDLLLRARLADAASRLEDCARVVVTELGRRSLAFRAPCDRRLASVAEETHDA